MDELMQLLTEVIGLSRETAIKLIDEFGELAVQRHAMHCLCAMETGRVKSPPAWFTASLKNNWSAPYGMPSEWLPTVLCFRMDENTFMQIEREVREEKPKAN